MLVRGYNPVQYVVAFNHRLLTQEGVKVHPAVCKIALPRLPQWADKVLHRIRTTVLKPISQLLPITVENLWFKVGMASGFLERFLLFYAHEFERWLMRELPRELSEHPEAFERVMGTDVLLPVWREMLGKDCRADSSIDEMGEQLFTRQLVEMQSRVDYLYAAAFAHGTAACLQYNEGRQQGLTSFLTSTGEFAGGTCRFAIYQELLAAMPFIEEMRTAKPKKTRRDLHEMFTAKLGQNVVGDYKRFCAICDDVGLVMSPRGRPRAPINTKRRVR